MPWNRYLLSGRNLPVNIMLGTVTEKDHAMLLKNPYKIIVLY
jgi:hypothetical protein